MRLWQFIPMLLVAIKLVPLSYLNFDCNRSLLNGLHAGCQTKNPVKDCENTALTKPSLKVPDYSYYWKLQDHVFYIVNWADTAENVARLTCAFRRVEGLVGLDEDVTSLKGHHHHLLHHHIVWELSLQVHVLPGTWIPAEVCRRNLNPMSRRTKKNKNEPNKSGPVFTKFIHLYIVYTRLFLFRVTEFVGAYPSLRT